MGRNKGWNKQSQPSSQSSLQPAKTRRRECWVVATTALVIAALVIWKWRSPVETRVKLDRQTFPQSRYLDMQTIADKVAIAVDQLIPGQVESYPRMGIVCFIAPRAWNNAPRHPPPVTLTGWSEAGEPDTTHPNTVRIALNDQVLHSPYSGDPELVFELAHELAHVKMDAPYDNYLAETMAVAISLKVIEELGYKQYRHDTVSMFIRRLPGNIQSAIDHQWWNEAAQYWQSEISKQKSGPTGSWDVPFGLVGSLLLETAEQPVWPNLLGIGAMSDHCVLSDGTPVSVPDTAMRFKVCLPAIRRLNKLSPALKALGYP
jgi:hypothetical protein